MEGGAFCEPFHHPKRRLAFQAAILGFFVFCLGGRTFNHPICLQTDIPLGTGGQTSERVRAWFDAFFCAKIVDSIVYLKRGRISLGVKVSLSIGQRRRLADRDR
jgi:hypothetical protein